MNNPDRQEIRQKNPTGCKGFRLFRQKLFSVQKLHTTLQMHSWLRKKIYVKLKKNFAFTARIDRHVEIEAHDE